MSLRPKLLAPLLLITALMGAYLYFFWIPRSLADAQTEHLKRVERHLDSVVEGLLPLLSSSQIDAIHENLTALKARNKDWVDIRLFDNQGSQIYPLLGETVPAISEDSDEMISVVRKIAFLDSDLGTLKVQIDFSDLLGNDRRQHDELGAMLSAMAIIFLVVLASNLELIVRRPVHQLASAARELAKRNFQAHLPPARNDEIGTLVDSFTTMRDDLRQHHDNLLHEIEERRKAEEEQIRLNISLTDRESDLRAVTDAVQDAIIRIQEDGRIVFWNPGAERLFGRNAAAAVGKEIHSLIAPSRHHAQAGRGLMSYRQDGNGPIIGKTVELTALRADGSEFPIELTTSPLSTPDGWHAVGVVRDIAERKHTEAELAQHRNHLEVLVNERTQELESKNASLSEALDLVHKTQKELVQSEKMASLGRLVAGFAHEINTPIGVAFGASTHTLETTGKLRPLLAQDEVDEAVFLAYLDEIDEASRLVYANLNRAADLVGSFKRTSVDQTRGTARRYNLRETLRDVLTSLHDPLKRTPVTTRIDCDEKIELLGYPGALGQIVTNLITNSLRHAFAGGTEAGEIAIAAHVEDDMVVVDYRDSGKGMDAATRARLFEPFFTTARETGGTGLGLFICHNLATSELKGSIRCESQPGQGSRFVLRYPVTAPA